MQLLQSMGRTRSPGKAWEMQGVIGWVFARLSGWQSERVAQRKQMQLVETLSLGGKRQLMLVTCGGEHFLVGGGLESVETIVRVRAEISPEVTAQRREEICR